jgi:hypothetical protein
MPVAEAAEAARSQEVRTVRREGILMMMMIVGLIIARC